MVQFALPALCALFVWWFSTGLVLYLVSLPRRTYRWSLLGATAAFGIAMWGLRTSSMDATASGAYLAFACAIAVWGWQEICFLTGVVTGPRTAPCPEGITGWQRVSVAIQAILYHELQLLVLAAAVALATADGVNQVGLWTYLVLWTMRLSAKLNLFLGVPFLHDEGLPAQIQYMRSYFRIRSMNHLFPVVVTAATIGAFVFFQASLGAEVTPFEATGQLLLGSLLALAVLEHWFMVVPLPVAALWSKFRARRTGRDAEVTADAETRSPSARAAKPALAFTTPTTNGG